MDRWSARCAARLEGLGLALALGLAAGVLILRGSLAAALGTGAALALGAVLAATLLHGVLRVAEDLARALGRCGRALFPGGGPDVVPWTPKRARRTGGRPVRFLRPAPADPAGAPPAPGMLPALLANAVGTVDLLTRRPLRGGDAVFVCVGRDARCGACFPRDIREDLRQSYADRCPSCGEAGRFVDAVLPEEALLAARSPS